MPNASCPAEGIKESRRGGESLSKKLNRSKSLIWTHCAIFYGKVAISKNDHQSECSYGTYHNPVRWVIVWRTRLRSLSKIGWDVRHSTLVHDLALVEQDEVIKRGEDLGIGLMNGKQDAGPSVGNFLQHVAQLNSTEAIQTTGRFYRSTNS